jgi:hypothetical protein
LRKNFCNRKGSGRRDLGGSVKKPLFVPVVAAVVALGVSCSSGSDVQSGSGPSTTAKDGESSGASEETTTTEAAAAAEPSTSAALLVQGTVTVPDGEPGKLSVVFTGAPSGDMGSTVPVIVRNNTDKPVGQIEINGTARAADGSLAGSGSSQGFQPGVLKPGEWGFGYVYFSSVIPADSTLEITARGDNVSSASDPFSELQLTVNEMNLNPGEYGSATYVGIVSNPDKTDSVSSAEIYIGCFDAASALLEVFSGYTDGEAVPGGTASFAVDTYEAPACAATATGASGYPG